MHDADNPTDPAVGGGGQVSYEAALQQVSRVTAWYTEQIPAQPSPAQRRAGAYDEDRLERLRAERQKCLADQRALEDAGPEEIALIAARYEARFRELTGQ
ncbi:hypothetical protein OG775_25745 [Streptomyces platensis]|uniref:hypothetical protein n=1 Tax=Streptomyces platensis TaxID=58346 RepID=UPI00225528CC|nr:hypothetical protein [Streptomyces platensis]MCX4638482.1 hypothetical protein [Streptomyces platensis]